MEKDTVVRIVTIPDDLAAALKENGIAEAFDALSYTLRKENVRSIEEAKAAETRAKRIQKTVDMLLAKKK
ncbi:MAG: YdeI/OmpD-associated family protein [Pyrinomonadaceae bacterium]